MVPNNDISINSNTRNNNVNGVRSSRLVISLFARHNYENHI